MEIIQVNSIINSNLIGRILEFYRPRARNYKDMISMQRMMSGVVDYILNKNDPYVLENAEILVRDSDHSYLCVSCGHGDRQFVVYETYPHHGQVEVVETVYKKFINDVINVREINRDTLENAVIRYCGVEGTVGGKKKQSLRKYLNAAKDIIDVVPDRNYWKNAKLTVTDAYVNTLTFVSGTGKYQFAVNDVEGEPKIVYDVTNDTIVHSNDKNRNCPWKCNVM